MNCVQGGALKLNLDEVLCSVKGKLLSDRTSNELFFDGVATDSRNVKENYLFFPLVGQQDGHKFIDSAVSNGASTVFVTETFAQSHKDEISSLKTKVANIISVNHTMYALQDLASLYVSKFPRLIKIGITGSSGKTTTKEIAVKVLSQKYNVVYNQGNLNSETGLPLSVFSIRPEHEVGIFEMGMNRRGEITELATVLKPHYGIITNIGTAHIGILGSRQNIAAEKKEIFKYFDKSCKGYVPSDDDFVEFLCQSEGEIKKFGFEMISNISENGLNGTSFEFEGEKITLPLCGKYNLKNALGVIALAKDCGLSVSQIKDGIESVKPIFGRNQIIEGNVTVVQDCYNANPDSMAASVEFFDSVKWNGKKIFVLGDMLELGEESEKEHQTIVKMAEKSDCDLCVLFGSEMSRASSVLSDKTKFFISAEKDDEAVEKVFAQLKNVINKGDLVLLKGSRGMALERISEKVISFWN